MADQLLAGIAPVFDNAGSILAGGSVTFYETGTFNLVSIYADSDTEDALTNPITLDAAGRPPQIFYTGAVAVKEVIKDAAGVVIDVIDPSPRFSVTASGANGVTFSPIPSNPATNVQDAIANVSSSLASFADSPVVTVGGGMASAISLISGKSLTSIATGQRLSFVGALDNTVAMTVSVDGLPTKAIKTVTGAATPAGYVRAGVLTEMYYDGAQWIASRQAEFVADTGTGSAWRYENGIQECFHSIYPGSIVTFGSGTLDEPWRSNAQTWVFPKVFSTAPQTCRATASLPGAPEGASRAVTGVFQDRSGTQLINIQAIRLTSKSSTYDARIDLYARGNWY
jgi:hypothetical protein